MPDRGPWPQPEHGAPVFALGGVVVRSQIPALSAHLQALLTNDDNAAVICDVGALRRADLAAVEALARLQLTARRGGRRLWLRRASPELRALLALTGLAEVLPLEPGRETEQREQPIGIEEEGDAGDPPA